jgi:hypothetical protein
LHQENTLASFYPTTNLAYYVSLFSHIKLNRGIFEKQGCAAGTGNRNTSAEHVHFEGLRVVDTQFERMDFNALIDQCSCFSIFFMITVVELLIRGKRFLSTKDEAAVFRQEFAITKD